MARLITPARVSVAAIVAAALALGAFAIRGVPVSTDEVLALWMVRDVGPGGWAEALRSGAAGDPVGYYSVLWLTARAFGESLIVFRAVSLAAFAVFFGATYALARRFAPWPTALAAAAIVFATEPAWAAVLARPYALAAAGVALAWLAWHRAARPWGWRARVAIGGALGFAVGMQFYAVVWPAAMLVAEAARSRRARRWHAAHFPAIGAAWLALLFTGALVVAIYRQHLVAVHASAFFARPSVGAWVQQYASVMADGHRIGLLVVLAVIGLGLWRAHQRRSESGGTDGLVVAAVMAAPLVTLAIAYGVTGHLVARHFYPAVIAAAAGAAMAFSGRRALAVPLIVAVVLLGWRNGTAASIAEAARWAADPRIEIVRAAAADAPVVVADGSDYLTLVESAPGVAWTFLTLPDPLAAPDPEPALFVARWARIRGDLRTREATAFLAETPTFLVLDTGSRRQGLMAWLAARGRLSEAGRTGDVVLWRFDAAP